ncbi:MAG: cobamide remodeling phosphodiesterase CbiR [Desulforhopalus sp.]
MNIISPTIVPAPLPDISFSIGAPSMVYGDSIVDNAAKLSDNDPSLKFVEIVLFHTPELHNIPTPDEIQSLNEIRQRTHILYTVHLPASLEIGSVYREVRDASIRLINEIWLETIVLEPVHYILHIPITPPTLVPVPGQYFTSEASQDWGDWVARAMDSLLRIRARVGGKGDLLLENINYSPKFLRPFLEAGIGELCLDTGHLLLGGENVEGVLVEYWDHIRELHLHGVRGYEEHLSLDVLPRNEIISLISCLNRLDYQGLINLEVFSREDLKSSLDILFPTCKI